MQSFCFVQGCGLGRKWPTPKSTWAWTLLLLAVTFPLCLFLCPSLAERLETQALPLLGSSMGSEGPQRQETLWSPLTHTRRKVADAAPDGGDPRTCLLLYTGVEGGHTKFLAIDRPDHATPAPLGLPWEEGREQ